MGFVPGFNVMQVNLNGSLHGIPVQNNLYFQKVSIGGIVQADALALANVLDAWWTADIAPSVGSDLTINELYMTDLTTQLSSTFQFSVSLVGTAPGPALPGNVCLSVGFITSGRGRSSRGRNYVAGLVEGFVTDNSVPQTYADDLRTGYSQLINDVGAVGFTWCVFSRVANGVDRVAGLVQPVTSVKIADLTVDTQRRRLR